MYHLFYSGQLLGHCNPQQPVPTVSLDPFIIDRSNFIIWEIFNDFY